jgi:hypothetical protein
VIQVTLPNIWRAKKEKKKWSDLELYLKKKAGTLSNCRRLLNGIDDLGLSHRLLMGSSCHGAASSAK